MIELISVVGNDHFIIPIHLSRQRAQHRAERVFAVIGGDDDGDQLSHRAAL